MKLSALCISGMSNKSGHSALINAMHKAIKSNFMFESCDKNCLICTKLDVIVYAKVIKNFKIKSSLFKVLTFALFSSFNLTKARFQDEVTFDSFVHCIDQC